MCWVVHLSARLVMSLSRLLNSLPRSDPHTQSISQPTSQPTRKNTSQAISSRGLVGEWTACNSAAGEVINAISATHMHMHMHMQIAVATASTLSLQNHAMIVDLLSKYGIRQTVAQTPSKPAR